MGRALLFKLGTLAGLVLALLIPLKLIEGKISERAATRAGVVAELANTSVGEQTVSGPLLVIPCAEHYVAVEPDGKGGHSKEPRTRDCTRVHVAESLTTNGSLTTENRYRGIYSARFFVSRLDFNGRFNVDAPVAAAAGVTREYGTPAVLMSVRDVRGIRGTSALTWSGNTYPFQPGAGPSSTSPGVHAALASKVVPAGVHEFSYSMEILGLQKLNFTPSAKQHDVTLTADWAHPSFAGRHLPAQRDVTKDGFSASWRISELASEGPRALQACGDPGCKALEPYAFGVSLIEPVDVYTQAHRAVKYALLFVLLTFAVFFLFEILRDLRIHPVQYGLVGLALAMFFLLLIALSEHMRFLFAYLIAAVACVGVITVYVQAVLRSAVRALAFAGMLTALYTMLYALLRSEDHSLLLGALLVFGVLATVMLMTRRIDWYGVGRTSESGNLLSAGKAS
ncbi:MAG TPA: cell envelope integrity protein CreD [Burkholderiales bacterium]|nr:cell envelope integrity protein CreD [Burkholderiales bacterium]